MLYTQPVHMCSVEHFDVPGGNVTETSRPHEQSRPRTSNGHIPRALLGGVPVDLLDLDDAVGEIERAWRADSPRPRAVNSVNLDHVHHFGPGSPLYGAQGIREGKRAELEWLHLIDGAPIAAQARRATGRRWERLAGSDLIDPVLRAAERDGVTVGVLGGSPDTHLDFVAAVARRYPRLRLSGTWAPTRAELRDYDASLALADEIRASETTVLLVCLGKPRQELWIDRYGPATGARVFLAFGAVVDFVAGRVGRAPGFVSSHGLEWAWRLALEPRRLYRRYLVQGPRAYRTLHRADLTSAPPNHGHITRVPGDGGPRTRVTAAPRRQGTGGPNVRASQVAGSPEPTADDCGSAP